MKAHSGGTERLLRSPIPAGVVVALLLVLVACGETRPPATLADGTTASSIPPELKSLGNTAVPTSERTVEATALDPRARACVDSSTRGALGSVRTVVERVDALGSSLTFRPGAGRFVFGCTSASSEPSTPPTWCGHVVGELRNARLVDPRLDIACRTPAGTAIGSAWIEPVAGARWIVVRDHALSQIYPTAASLPVRVTTTAVDLATATAVFRVEQYDRSGARVAEATVRTAVAG